MVAAHKHPSWLATFFGAGEGDRELALELLRQAFVREKQHAMRYRQHGEKMRYTHFRERLIRLAQAEDRHAALIEQKLAGLGDQAPEVVPVRVSSEQNSWYYLRNDLEEEQRCAGELEADLAVIARDYPGIADLLRRIEREGRTHRAELRDMLAKSDAQAAAVA